MCRNNTFKTRNISRFSLVRCSTRKGFVLDKLRTIEVSFAPRAARTHRNRNIPKSHALRMMSGLPPCVGEANVGCSPTTENEGNVLFGNAGIHDLSCRPAWPMPYTGACTDLPPPARRPPGAAARRPTTHHAAN
jgi:hypothetical protein